jgi:hypothetical protein
MEGLGDRVERYMYCLYISKVLQSTLALEEIFSGPQKHSGHDLYKFIISDLFDMNLTSWETVKTDYVINASIILNIPKLFHDYEMLEGPDNYQVQMPCNSVYYASIVDNCARWCFMLKSNIDFVTSTMPYMQTNRSKEYCYSNKLGFLSNSSTVNVVLHIRTGDRCYRCGDKAYFQRIISSMKNAISMSNVSSIRSGVTLKVASQGNVDFIRDIEPSVRFSDNPTILGDICDILTSDIVISTGSSFAYVKFFSNTSNTRPLLFEERRKNYWDGELMRAHLSTQNSAVLVKNGEILISIEEVARRIRNIFTA